MNIYFVWVDDKNKAVSKPDLYTSLDDADWEKKPAKALCFVKGNRLFLYRHFDCKHQDFDKWEYSRDGSTQEAD